MIVLKEFIRKLHHYQLVRFLLYGAILVGLPIVGLYVHFIEPKWIQLTRLKIPIRKLPRAWTNFRIVQLTDIHFGPTNHSVAFINQCVQITNNLKPDVIFLTGDYVQWDETFITPLAETLAHLKSPQGVFAILGNHDYGVCHPHEPPHDPIDYRWILTELQKNGIHVLHNERVVIKKGNGEIHVVGLGDYWTPHFNPGKAFLDLPSDQPTILLSHNPDSIDALKGYQFDLMLSGHVHGGQVSFPLIGPLVVPVKHRHLRRGLHQLGEKWLYVSRGIGYTFKVRLLSRPEIACIDLIPA